MMGYHFHIKHAQPSNNSFPTKYPQPPRHSPLNTIHTMDRGRITCSARKLTNKYVTRRKETIGVAHPKVGLQ
jgi:hypothetical protein